MDCSDGEGFHNDLVSAKVGVRDDDVNGKEEDVEEMTMIGEGSNEVASSEVTMLHETTS